MSVTQLNIDVKIAGADEAAAKLQKIEQAADQTGKKAEKAGGLFARFEAGVKGIDDAVDKVEKPMRTFSGALDIASIALGAGLAGPLGQVIQQVTELGVKLYETAAASSFFKQSAEDVSAGLQKIGKDATDANAAVEDLFKRMESSAADTATETLIARTGGAAIAASASRAKAANDEANALATALLESQLQQSEAQEKLAAAQKKLREENTAENRLAVVLLKEQIDNLKLAERELNGKLVDADRKAATLEQRAQQIEDRARTLAGLPTAAEEQQQKKDEENARLREAEQRKRDEDRKRRREAAQRLADAEKKKQQEREKAENDQLNAIFVAGEMDAQEGLAAIQADIQAADELRKKAIERAARVASGELSISDAAPIPAGDNPLLQALLEESAAELDKQPVKKEATALEQSLKSLSDSAMSLETMGVQALQSFSQAAGQALASLVIDGDKAGVSFKKLAGEVAAGLSAQAFGYAVFLSALGVAATLAPVALGALNPAGLFAGAAAMAGTGLLLGVTARALGASTYGPGQSSQSAGGSAQGAQDRVSSFSAGGGGAQPVAVTVVLGVDEVSNVLVRQSQREARSGSLSSSRLAVA